MNGRKASDMLFGALVVWSVIATAFVAYTRFAGREAAAENVARPLSTRVEHWAGLAQRGYDFGRSTGKPTIVVFSDFQCPYCRQFSHVVDSLLEKYPGVRVVERHFPIESIHGAAFHAAIAAECARDVDAYESMRRVLFRDQILVEQERWASLAADARIKDTSAVAACVDAQRHAASVRSDMAAGQGIGITGTPSFLVNDTLFSGTMSFVELEKHVSQRLRSN